MSDEAKKAIEAGDVDALMAILMTPETLAHRAEFERRIGEFIVVFSQLEINLKFRLRDLLELPPLAFDIVTGPYDFAILVTVLRETLLRTMPLLDEQKALVRSLDSQLREVNNDRLLIAHGSWTMVPGLSAARHVARTRLEAKEHFKSAEEVHSATMRVIAAYKAVGLLFDQLAETWTILERK